MLNSKPQAGSQFPAIKVRNQDDQETLLVNNQAADRWTIVIVYRGQHCPICTNFLNAVDSMYGRFQGIKVDIVAVSADSAAQLQENIDNDLQVSFPLFYSLQMADMHKLGLYISDPRSEAETDHPFAEPGLFVVNSKNQMQLIDIASGPFSRPNIDQLFEGLSFARENNYPIRGTHSS